MRTTGFSALRRAASPLENHLADEVLAGRLSRRALLRHARRIGMSAPLLAALGGAAPARATPEASAGAAGATIRVACATPAGTIDPLTVSESGGALMLCQTGEFLIFDGPDMVLRPMLALSWSPNADASIWIFRLRPGVRFHDGSAFTAADVVATMDRLADPRGGSNALSVLRGVLSPGGTRRIDDLTVAFHLDAPNGNFPYAVSSDNYNAIMLPASYGGEYERDFPGTGPFRLARYTPKSGAVFVRNAAYWGGPARPARTEFGFFTDQAPQILALQDGQVDVIAQIAVQGAQGLLRDAATRVIGLPSAIQRQVHMRTDRPPFADPRVRRAVALSLDRPGIVFGLYENRGQTGNDSPFAPVYPSTDRAVPQRCRDIAQARALMQAAGCGAGFSATLTTERFQDIPDYAVVLQNACAEIGISLDLRIEAPAQYYGTAQPGASDWLDSTMGITEYGHRGVPDAILQSALGSGGAWNSARFRDPEYDRLVAGYLAALDLPAQRAAARRIETLLLDQTPVVISHFIDYLVATAPGVSGVQATAISQLFLRDAALP
jgi:peptide/nickel transport system substrate-binding protein